MLIHSFLIEGDIIELQSKSFYKLEIREPILDEALAQMALLYIPRGFYLF